MVRSLWTAATGMIAQQTNLDTIANNLANVNTTGYKTEVNEFKSLLYQTIQTKTTSANGERKPSSAQVGLGVRNASISSVFKQGPLLSSEIDTNFAIDGKGFFALRSADGRTYYTRNGNFKFTLSTNGGNMLATSDGEPILDRDGQPLILSSNYIISNVTVTADGTLCYPDELNNPQPIRKANGNAYQIGLWQFQNPNGLEKIANSRFAVTDASGPVINEFTNNNVQKSSVIQGYLEGSNVNVADEMVNMITTQRAYEFNSKAITASD